MKPLTQSESFLDRVEPLFSFEALLACQIPSEYTVINSGFVVSDGTKTWCMPWMEFSDGSKIFYDGVRFGEWSTTEPNVPFAPGEEGSPNATLMLISDFKD